MHRLSKLVIASHNKGKVREIGELLSPLGVETRSVAELGLPKPDETETIFSGNARIKALAAAKATGWPALSDDSGLAVDALDGAPGVCAADWAEIPKSEGGGRDFNMAMWHVNRLMGESPGPDTARFICALCLAWPDGATKVYEGRVEGHIVWPPRGDKGFGYDPIFCALGDDKTFAEIDPKEKHAKSHRADAFVKFLNDQFPNV
ncbi:MAG: non-canonical purine NTP pyrophosphatase [Hyphomonadaceae bacterium]|nr:non-canonical purine NTP pyrophosphatase [Hyphomonadaceae bacterium]MBC6413272.1 non-canonical purine NTP pyrophosphatase [Hyphomonadaceae bacterium]